MSEQMTVVQPNVSTAGIFRTRAFCLAIWCMPMASAPVTIAARASGTAATARDTANMTMCKTKVIFKPPVRACRRMLIPATRKQIARLMRPSHLPISSVRFSKGVFFCSAPPTSSAMRPNSVSMPVARTAARARP